MSGKYWAGVEVSFPRGVLSKGLGLEGFVKVLDMFTIAVPCKMEG